MLPIGGPEVSAGEQFFSAKANPLAGFSTYTAHLELLCCGNS